jgi:flagellar motor switch protein FliM
MTDILSQEEIDALLGALDSGEIEATDIDSPGMSDSHARLYDFKRPDKFSKEQLRTIQMLHETFGRLWSSALSGMLRNLVNMSVISVDQLTYKEFLLSMADPSVICIFALPPLEGRAVIEFSPAIAFPLIDRLLGGHGAPTQKIRELTDIEKRIISTLIEEGLMFLKEAWVSMTEFFPEMLSVESNPMFVQIVTPSDMVLLISLEAKIGDLTGVINICYPYVVLEPVLTHLSQQFLFASTGKGATKESRENILSTLFELKVDIEVMLGETELTFGDVLDMKTGDVVKLSTKIDDELDVRVSERVKFVCVPGNTEGHFAALVTRSVTNAEEKLKDVRV